MIGHGVPLTTTAIVLGLSRTPSPAGRGRSAPLPPSTRGSFPCLSCEGWRHRRCARPHGRLWLLDFYTPQVNKSYDEYVWMLRVFGRNRDCLQYKLLMQLPVVLLPFLMRRFFSNWRDHWFATDIGAADLKRYLPLRTHTLPFKSTRACTRVWIAHALVY